MFGLLTDSDSDSDDTRRRRSVRDPLEDETQRKEVEAAISAELMRIRQRPKPKHEWNFVKQIVQRFVDDSFLLITCCTNYGFQSV